MKKTYVMALILWMCSMTLPGRIQAQGGGCAFLTFTAEQFEPCKYRLQSDNSNECYTGLRILLSEGSYVSWEANVPQGWTATLISPTELQLTHTSGIIPIGINTPVDFFIPSGISPLLSVLWDYTCPTEEGCVVDLPLEGCPIITDGCIEGFVYMECDELPFINQEVLSDWTIELLDEIGNVLVSEVTGLDGAYSFCDLPAGTYIVQVRGQPGWTANVPPSGQSTIQLNVSEFAEVNFGMCSGCSCDSIYVDIVSTVITSVDTCAFNVVMHAIGPYCYDRIQISLDTGKITSWVVMEPEWVIELIDSQNIQLFPANGLFPTDPSFPMILYTTGSSDYEISMSTFWDAGAGEQECKQVFSRSCSRFLPPTCCPSNTTAGPELIVNGNFEAGNIGFTSDHHFEQLGSHIQLGDYGIRDFYTLDTWSLLSNFVTWVCVDHTTGSPTGKFLACNYSEGIIPYDAIWESSVNVVQGEQYTFCAYTNNMYRYNNPDPVVQLVINGVGVVASATIPEIPNDWVKLSALWVAPTTGTYTLEIRSFNTYPVGNDPALDDISFRACTLPLDTCYCASPSFTNLYMRGTGGPSTPIECETSYDNIGCPDPGYGFSFTGLFECKGDSCTTQSYVYWDLEGPSGTSVSSGSVQGTYFGINLLPAYFAQVGIYTMKLSGICNLDTCTCSFQFVVDCPSQCPCELGDIQKLDAAVNDGFSVAKYNSSCNTCFAPVSVSECESVSWYLNDTMGSPIGTSLGTQSFCYDFAVPGTYTIIMVVTRKKADGTNCETFSKTQMVTTNCLEWTKCTSPVIDNPTFGEGAVAGGFLSGGATEGWTTLSGEPVLIEGSPGSDDGWSIQLTGNLDSADILVMSDPVCLTRQKGVVTSKNKVEHWGDPHENLNGKHIKDWQGKQRLFIGDNIDLSECDGINCFELGTINYSLADTGWIEYQIPYDLSLWLEADTCLGSGGGDQMIEARLAIFVTSPFGNNQGGIENRARILIDEICFDESLVSIPSGTDVLSFKMYPNPNSGEFIVEFSKPASLDSKIRIVGLTGKVMLEKDVSSGSFLQSIDATSLPQAMYFLQILSKSQVIAVNRFVKQ